MTEQSGKLLMPSDAAIRELQAKAKQQRNDLITKNSTKVIEVLIAKESRAW